MENARAFYEKKEEEAEKFPRESNCQLICIGRRKA